MWSGIWITNQVGLEEYSNLADEVIIMTFEDLFRKTLQI